MHDRSIVSSTTQVCRDTEATNFLIFHFILFFIYFLPFYYSTFYLLLVSSSNYHMYSSLSIFLSFHLLHTLLNCSSNLLVYYLHFLYFFTCLPFFFGFFLFIIQLHYIYFYFDYFLLIYYTLSFFTLPVIKFIPSYLFSYFLFITYSI
jgi:hypothetical protein